MPIPDTCWARANITEGRIDRLAKKPERASATCTSASLDRTLRLRARRPEAADLGDLYIRGSNQGIRRRDSAVDKPQHKGPRI